MRKFYTVRNRYKETFLHRLAQRIGAAFGHDLNVPVCYAMTLIVGNSPKSALWLVWVSAPKEFRYNTEHLCRVDHNTLLPFHGCDLPSEMLTDRHAQFVSDLMGYKPYHAGHFWGTAPRGN